MFPERTKSALVKKEMRILRDIIGGDEDSGELLLKAMVTATKRVVVKRPKGAHHIAGAKPAVEMKGKKSRYDIYFPS